MAALPALQPPASSAAVSMALEMVAEQVHVRVGGDWFEQIWSRQASVLSQLAAVALGGAGVAFLGWTWWAPIAVWCVWWAGMAGVPSYLLNRPPGMPSWASEQVVLTLDERHSIGELARAAGIARKAATSGVWEPSTGRDLWLMRQRVQLQLELARSVRTSIRR